MRHRSFAVVLCGALAAGLLAPGVASSADVSGSGDHPLVARYPGSEIVEYQTKAFDEYRLLTGPVASRDAVGSALDLEGRVVHMVYELHDDRSTLEVLRNYRLALEEQGFEFLFDCKNETCGGTQGRYFNHAVAAYGRFGDQYADQRYLAARLARPAEGDVYLSLYMVRYLTRGGGGPPVVSIQADVIEIQPMDVGMELKLADEMGREILQEGRSVLYGIYFDFDSDVLKPESQPTLAEIGKLLKESPQLRVLVVGHTDNKGTLSYNLDLSLRRARAVVAALVRQAGIEASRLEGHGVGYLAPVASNRQEEGRALNRRVELVER